MSNYAPFRPNMLMVQFVFDNVWTVEQLEDYVTSYPPGGVPLSILRRALGYSQAGSACYALTLSKTAAVLYALGHTKTVPEVLLELLLRLNPLLLTNNAYTLSAPFPLSCVCVCARARGRRWGTEVRT